ncbi:MAG: MBL fold metallo-hydrolase, partial [Pseudomonadota bacterium]
MPMHRVLLLSLCCAISGSVGADDEASATYLANQGVLVEFGDHAVLFDPLFDNDFGRFQRVPEDMQQALLDGEPPFDNVAAVFVSHYHGDHFSPGLMIEYLGRQPDVRLYGPMQATNALRQAAGADADILARVSGLAL